MNQYRGRQRPRSVSEALQNLDPEDIERKRQNLLSRPPASSPSGTSTAYVSDPDYPQRHELEQELLKTYPDIQFHREVTEETEVIEKAMREGYLKFRPGLLEGMVPLIVQERWIERGIWCSGDHLPCFLTIWNHANVKAQMRKVIPVTSAMRCQSDNNADDTAVARSHEVTTNQTEDSPFLPDLDASRPCHQFEHDVEMERRRLEAGNMIRPIPDMAYKRIKQRWDKDGLWSSDWTQKPEIDLAALRHLIWLLKDPQLPDADSCVGQMACQNVKSRWIEEGRWDSTRWVDWPGQLWRHEQPEERALLKQLGGNADRSAYCVLKSELLSPVRSPLYHSTSPQTGREFQTRHESFSPPETISSLSPQIIRGTTPESNPERQLDPNRRIARRLTNTPPPFSPQAPAVTPWSSRPTRAGPPMPSMLKRRLSEPGLTATTHHSCRRRQSRETRSHTIEGRAESRAEKPRFRLRRSRRLAGQKHKQTATI